MHADPCHALRIHIVALFDRTEKRENRRMAKAEAAAKLDTAIEKELLQRLRNGTYGDIVNFPSAEYLKVTPREQAMSSHQSIMVARMPACQHGCIC